MYVQRIYACRLHFKTPITVAKSLHLSAPSLPGPYQAGSPWRRGLDRHYPVNSDWTLSHKGDSRRDWWSLSWVSIQICINVCSAPHCPGHSAPRLLHQLAELGKAFSQKSQMRQQWAEIIDQNLPELHDLWSLN